MVSCSLRTQIASICCHLTETCIALSVAHSYIETHVGISNRQPEPSPGYRIGDQLLSMVAKSAR